MGKPTKEQAEAKVARAYELAKIAAMERLMHLQEMPLSLAGFKTWEEAVDYNVKQVRKAAQEGDDYLNSLGYLEDEG